MPGTNKENPDTGRRIYSYQEILLPVWINRKRIFSLSFILALLTLAVNFFLLPPYFEATATLLPEARGNGLSAMAGLTDVTQLANLEIGLNDIARLYPFIATSETVLRPVIMKEYRSTRLEREVNLIEYFEVEDVNPETEFEEALKQVRGLTTAAYDAKSGIVTVSVEMKEPELAAEVANGIVAEMDKFMRFKKTSSASEQLKWINARLVEVQQDLRAAEENLRVFRETNRRVADSPQLLLELDRLAREVQVRSTMYIELKKQAELAKIEELKNMTIVNVLDPARAPVKKSRPRRATNAVLMFLASFLFGSLFFIVRSLYGPAIASFLAPFRTPPRAVPDP